MGRMSLAEFEERYRSDPDPWGYTTSDYERRKYAATLAACGEGPFGHALELGSSIGVFSELLAPRCERLTTIDAAPTAVGAARRRLATAGHVRVIHGRIPDAIPDGPFDLVVASEILYYLSVAELDATLARLGSRMAPRARLVAVHWRPAGPERPLDAQHVHGLLHEQPWLTAHASAGTDDYALDVMESR
jgi:cyclopropane fatty-acyl-phospholipid synthase-like methyltransferase